ncbi:hypothetical protein ASF69_04525 [Rhizobium sp. Leaf311]|uniref:hypothetical protein n=1 Tax=Rhizobium sp. Leaf311 TaxID=1736332 RepID=UPI0007133BAE|nr:hypothetical protein [Rhizobium sp. Leaf311]KQQ46498.1 hypothetical protein ASF69_04525 [Rhizobium sp. Leaf311]
MTGPEKDALEALQPFLGDELAKAIVEFRRHTKKAPLTGYAAKLLVKEYQATGNAVAAAEMQISMSWQGFKASWYFNEIAKTGQRQQSQLPHRRTGDMADFANDLMEGFYERSNVPTINH